MCLLPSLLETALIPRQPEILIYLGEPCFSSLWDQHPSSGLLVINCSRRRHPYEFISERGFLERLHPNLNAYVITSGQVIETLQKLPPPKSGVGATRVCSGQNNLWGTVALQKVMVGQSRENKGFGVRQIWDGIHPHCLCDNGQSTELLCHKRQLVKCRKIFQAYCGRWKEYLQSIRHRIQALHSFSHACGCEYLRHLFKIQIFLPQSFRCHKPRVNKG